MNKKAFIFLYICVFAFLISIGVFYRNVGNQAGGDTLYLGEHEIEVFEAYQEGEEYIYYIQLSAQLSADKASKDNFKQEFESEFSKYLKNYDLTMEDYAITYTSSGDSTKIIGICNKQLEVKREDFVYKAYPNFRVVVPFSLENEEGIF